MCRRRLTDSHAAKVHAALSLLEQQGTAMSAHDAPNENTQHTQLHRRLAKFNAGRLGLSTPSPRWQDDLASEHSFRLMEGHYLEALRATVQAQAAGAAGNAGHFVHGSRPLSTPAPASSTRCSTGSRRRPRCRRCAGSSRRRPRARRASKTCWPAPRSSCRRGPSSNARATSGTRWATASKAPCTARCSRTWCASSTCTPASRPPCGSRWRWPTPWWAWRPRAATRTTPSARSASSSSRPPAA
jgi:hypothetical protein